MEEEEAIATTTYWCHMCSRTVNPLMEAAEIKCPLCASGFVEEMAEEEEEEEEEEQHSPDNNDHRPNNTSLWAPILMQLMNDPTLRTSNQSVEDEAETENDVDSHLQEILTRRGRRRSVSVIRLLHGARAVSTLEPENNGDGGRARGRVIMLQSDSLSGSGFESLLQRLAENDPNRYGTPPARKEAVEALATVKIQEAATLQCSVCLEDFEFGMETKEMPCKHKFHGDCLLPWLELHSSCPVCRYELPSDETNGVGESSSSSTSSQGSENSDGSHHPEQEEEEEEEEEEDGDGIEYSSIPWLFSSLFSSSSQGSSNPSTDTN